MKEDMENPDGFFARLAKKNANLEKRYNKFEKWLETNEFEPIFQKLLEKNGDERSTYCFNKGHEKNGTPLMEFLCGYITTRIETVENEKFSGDFSSGIWFFKDYWFQLICGQGCFWKIYNKDFECIEHV